jgi:N-acetylglucosamine-6-phosphate deacetylase
MPNPTTLAARHYVTGQPIDVAIAEGRIASITPSTHANAAALPWVAPAFVDLQVNGFLGKEFGDPSLTVDHVEEISRAIDAHGCVGYAPTVTTNSFEILCHALATLRRAGDERAEVARRIVGFHLEGPYISPEDGPRGAHPLAHARPPDWDEFCRLNDAAGGRIRILTMSPEYDGAPQFIERAVAAGVVVAIGHTAADSAQIKAAVDAGAKLSTHLGNGAHGQLRRHPNYIWDQLAEDRLWASLIVDGHHLPPSVVQSFVRAKTPSRCLLVSDITGMAGMPPGDYPQTSLGHIEILEDGRHVVGGQRQFLAGASQPIGVGVANVMRFAGIDLRAAVDMASLRPAQLIGIEPHRLEVGAPANLVMFRLDDSATGGALRIESTINAGEVVFTAGALTPARPGDC